MQHLTEYEGKPLQGRAARRARPARERRRREQGRSPRTASARRLLKRVKQVLRERVDEVRVGGRLRQSAACLVLNEHDLGLPDARAVGRRRAPSARGGPEPRAESRARARAATRSRDGPGAVRTAVIAVVRAGRARRRPAARRSRGVRSAAQRAAWPSSARRAARDESRGANAQRRRGSRSQAPRARSRRRSTRSAGRPLRRP